MPAKMPIFHTMNQIKNIFIFLFIACNTIYATSTASLVAKKSNTKGYSYSKSTRLAFIRECSENANQNICYCVLDKIQQQYSEKQYLKLDADLRKNIDHPAFIAFISDAANTCDEEYAHHGNFDPMTNSKFTKDIEMVLLQVANLTSRGPANFESQRDRTSEDLNDDYANGSSGGFGDGLAGLLGGGNGGIATHAKGSIKTPSTQDIIFSQNDGNRSENDIIKVIRQRTPGLRHLYNNYFKKKPGFQGKITLKFTVMPSGRINNISIIASTTNFKEFDNEIKDAVRRWTFSEVPTGNTTVTIPFTFSE